MCSTTQPFKTMKLKVATEETVVSFIVTAVITFHHHLTSVENLAIKRSCHFSIVAIALDTYKETILS